MRYRRAGVCWSWRVRTGLMVMCILGAVNAAEGWALEESLKVEISTTRNSYKVGEPIAIVVRKKNVSAREIQISKLVGREVDNDEFVIRRTGNEVKRKTAYLKTLSITRETIKPGESIEEKAILNEDYDMGIAGTYRIFIRAGGPVGLTGVDSGIESNALELRILD